LLPGKFQKDICYSAQNPALMDRARPTKGSDRGKHDLTLVVSHELEKNQPGMQPIAAGSPESQSADLKAENIATLKALFPELLSERIANGKTETAINVDSSRPTRTADQRFVTSLVTN
jgi:hypothetical protein